MSLASIDAHDDITDARQGHAHGDVTDAKDPPPRGGGKQSVPTPASASMTIIPTTIIVYITFRTGRGDDPYDTFTKGPESYIQRKGFKKTLHPVIIVIFSVCQKQAIIAFVNGSKRYRKGG